VGKQFVVGGSTPPNFDCGAIGPMESAPVCTERLRGCGHNDDHDPFTHFRTEVRKNWTFLWTENANKMSVLWLKPF